MQRVLLLQAAWVALQRPVEAVGADMATLWQFLILMCVAVPVGGGYAAAKHGRYGLGGYALAIAVGLAVGVCCGWVMFATHGPVGRKLDRLTSETSPAKREWCFFGFYVAKFLWMVVAAFLGFWLSSVLLRIVFGGPF